MRRGLKRTALVLVSLVIVATNVISSVNFASAVSSLGDSDSLRSKILYQMLAACATNANAYNYHGQKTSIEWWELAWLPLLIPSLISNSVDGLANNGSVDISNNGKNVFDNSIGLISWGYTKYYGAYYEALITKHPDNQWVSCGAQDKDGRTLLDMAATEWGLSVTDILCNGHDPGILAATNRSGTELLGCTIGTPPKLNPDAYFWPSSGAGDYLEQLVMERAFPNGVPGDSLLEFTPMEEYLYYKEIFSNYCSPSSSNPDEDGAFEYYKDGTSTAWWYITDTAGSRSIRLSQSDYMTCNEIKEKIKVGSDTANAFEAAYTAAVDAGESPNTSPNIQSSSFDLSQCNDAAKLFSWFICPLLDMILGVTVQAFTVIGEFLKVDPQIFAEGDGALGDAWGIFRDITNVILVIIFIVIILSQVTGFGIDNYGIKKILPRLIVIAVLINLSYIICQLLVDISNIVGSNLYGFLENLGNGFSLSDVDTAGGAVLASAIAAVITILLIVILNPVTLLPLVIAVMGAVIAAVFMFLLLGVRQAAVAVFIVLAPLAFAANILPNTTGLFKKWLNIFKAMLILYPICALVMGAGYFGSMLLLSIGHVDKDSIKVSDLKDIVMSLVALILLVGPIFFVPKLTKGAFDGLGKLGATMTGLGGKLSGMATGATKPALERGLKNSRAGQAHEARVANKEFKRARKNDERVLNGRFGRGKASLGRRALAWVGRKPAPELTENDKMRLARAQQGMKQRAVLQSQANLASAPGYMDAQLAAIEDAEQTSLMKGYTALYDKEHENGTIDDAKSFFNTAMDSGDSARIMAAANVMDRFGTKGVDEIAGYFDKLGKDGAGIITADGARKRKEAIDKLSSVVNGMSGMQGKIDARAADLGESLKARTDRMGDVSVLNDMDAPQLASQGGAFYGRLAGKVAAGSTEERLVYSTLNSSSPAVRDKLTKEGREYGIQSMLVAPASISRSGPTPSQTTPPASTGNVRGNVAGDNGGRLIVQGPDAGLEQTDSGIIISH